MRRRTHRVVVTAVLALSVLWAWPSEKALARERRLAVEVDRLEGAAEGRCEVALELAPGHQGLVAARRPWLFELVSLALQEGSSRPGLEAHWDGVWLGFRGVGSCRTLIAEASRLWRLAAELKAPPQVDRPAVPPAELRVLRQDAALARAVAVALGAAETVDNDLAQLELLVDAMAVAPGRLTVRGRPSPRDRSPLPRASHDGVDVARPTLTPRAVLMPTGVDGTTQVHAMWQLTDVESGSGALLAALLGHPGHRLYERLVADMGLVHTLEARWLSGPSMLVISMSLPGPGHGPALDRLFVELIALGRSLKESPADEAKSIAGAASLARVAAPSPRELSGLLSRLDRERAALVVEPGREDLDTQVAHIDQALIARWVAATMDLRCPAPDETRDRNTLLSENHGLESRRYLAISRALGRDTERMRQLDRELIDRCEEDKKLRRMLRADRILALHKEVRCGALAGPDDVAEIARRKLLFLRFRVDSSAYRPLVAMLRRSPVQGEALKAIEERCPGVP